MKVFLAVLSLGLFTFFSLNYSAGSIFSAFESPGHVSPAEFKEYLDNEEGVLLDIRTPEEYGQERLAGSVLLNIYDETNFRSEAAKLDRSEPVFVYCRSSTRSRRALDILESLGFEVVVGLEGGINAWKNAGFSIIR